MGFFDRTRIVRTTFLLAALALCAPAEAFAQIQLKLATLAPEKSSWMKVFKRASKDIKKRTGGAVSFKIFGGGSQGDEKIVVEKMRTGQLHAAAITAVGLAEIAPEVLVLQAPGLITDYRALDRVRNKLRSRFEGSIAAGGFELLGWGDVGIIYFYSAHSIQAPEDLKKARVWVWNADPIARQMAKTSGISPVPLGVPDVLPSLNTGHIDTFYTSPLGCLSLQWFTKVKYRNDHPVGVAIGAIVVSKEAMAGLSAEHQTAVREALDKWSGALVKKVRKDNGKATKILAKKGITDVSPDPTSIAAWDSMAVKIQNALVGKVYPKDLLQQVRSIAGKK